MAAPLLHGMPEQRVVLVGIACLTSGGRRGRRGAADLWHAEVDQIIETGRRERATLTRIESATEDYPRH